MKYILKIYDEDGVEEIATLTAESAEMLEMELGAFERNLVNTTDHSLKLDQALRGGLE